MGEILFPTHCPACGRELVHRLNMQYEPKVKPGVQMFHKADNTPICEDALARDKGKG